MSNEQNKEFNVGNEDVTTQESMILHLQDLTRHEGWKILMRVSKNNIEVLEKMIIKKCDENGNPLYEKAVDRLRDKYGYLTDITSAPENLIKQLRLGNDKVVEELDPYYKDIKDIENDKENPDEQG